MSTIQDVADEEYVALTTFRTDGTSVTTPVWVAHEDGRLFIYTPGRSWKVARVRRSSVVRLAPCDFHGHVHGPTVDGDARVLPGDELQRATRPLTAKYGLKFRWFTLVLLLSRARRRGGPPVGLEIICAEDEVG